MEDFLYPLLTIYYKSPLWVKNFVGFVYRSIPNRIRYGNFYKIYSLRIKRFQKLKGEALKEAHHKLLIDIVNYAIQNIKFYNKYTQISSVEEIQNLPIVSKNLIDQNKSDFVNPKKKHLMLKANTGGSSGTPFSFYIHKGKTRPKEKAHFDWYWSQYGYKTGVRILMIRGKSLRNNALYEYNSLDNKLIINSNSINKDTIGEIHKKILKFKPKFIHAYPSALSILTKVYKEYTGGNPISIKIKAIFLGSEGLTVNDYTNFEEFFNAKVVNWYGHSECLVHANRNSKEGDFKFYPFYGFVELLDENDKIINKPNKIGRLIATGFDNEVMPLIRYDTGDLGELSECDELLSPTYVCLKHIEGRTKNFIYLLDGTTISLTSLIFGQHYKQFDYIKELQITQYKKGEILLSIVPIKIFTENEIDQLRNAILRTVKKNTLTINIETVNQTKKTPRGKHIFLIQHIV